MLGMPILSTDEALSSRASHGGHPSRSPNPYQQTQYPYQYGPPQSNYQYGPPQSNYQYGPPQSNYQYGPPPSNYQYGAPSQPAYGQSPAPSPAPYQYSQGPPQQSNCPSFGQPAPGPPANDAPLPSSFTIGLSPSDRSLYYVHPIGAPTSSPPIFSIYKSPSAFLLHAGSPAPYSQLAEGEWNGSSISIKHRGCEIKGKISSMSGSTHIETSSGKWKWSSVGSASALALKDDMGKQLARASKANDKKKGSLWSSSMGLGSGSDMGLGDSGSGSGSKNKKTPWELEISVPLSNAQTELALLTLLMVRSKNDETYKETTSAVVEVISAVIGG